MKYIRSEFEEQCDLVTYLELKHLKFSKVAQETYTTNWGVTTNNRKSGLRKGVPDMIIIIPKGKKNLLLFIEMKKVKGSSVSIEQLEWQKELNKCPGVRAEICYGFEEAKKVIDSLI
jgi:hypothetical protein